MPGVMARSEAQYCYLSVGEHGEKEKIAWDVHAHSTPNRQSDTIDKTN
jgi:hypothetical protein